MLAQFPQAHTEVVTSLAFSPHASAPSSVLCSTSGDDTAALWDVQGGTLISRLQGHHRGPVNHALFVPSDANGLLTASDDCSIALWDLRRPDRPVGALTGFHEGVNKMLLLPASVFPNCGVASSAQSHLVASACDDGRVYVHALLPLPDAPAPDAAGALPSLGSLVDTFWASTSTVNDVVCAPNPTMVITASEDGALRTWRLLFDSNALTDQRLVCSLDEFDNPVNHVAVVPQGLMGTTDADADTARAATAAAATTSGSDPDEGAAGGTTVETAYEPQDGEEPLSIASRQSEERRGLRRWVLAACSECVYGVDLSVPTGVFGSGTRSFMGHADYVRGLEFTPAGTLITVSDDGTAVEWDLAANKPVNQVKLHDGLVMASALSRSGDALATGADGGEIRIWRLPFHTEQLAEDANH